MWQWLEKKVRMALGDFGPPINQRKLRWVKCNLAAVPLLPGTGLVLGLQDSANKRECTYFVGTLASLG